MPNKLVVFEHYTSVHSTGKGQTDWERERETNRCVILIEKRFSKERPKEAHLKHTLLKSHLGFLVRYSVKKRCVA